MSTAEELADIRRMMAIPPGSDPSYGIWTVAQAVDRLAAIMQRDLEREAVDVEQLACTVWRVPSPEAP